MDGTQIPSSGQDESELKIFSTHLSNGVTSLLLANCGATTNHMDENGIRGGRTEESLDAQTQLSKTKESQIDAGHGEFSRPGAIDDQHVSLSGLHSSVVMPTEPGHDKHCLAANGIQGEATVSQNSVLNGAEVGHTGSDGTDVKGGVVDVGNSPHQQGPVQVEGGPHAMEASQDGKDQSVRRDGLVSQCVAAGGNASDKGAGRLSDEVALSTTPERRHDDNGMCHQSKESTSQTEDMEVQTVEAASKGRALLEELSREMVQLKADNEQLLQRLSESSRLHEEKSSAFEEALKDLELKCSRYQVRIESTEHQLKEVTGASHRLQQQVKEEKEISTGCQAKVKALEQLLESERTKAANKMAELEKALALKTEKIAKIQSEAQSEKEDLVSKLVVIEHEKKRADDELVTADKKLKEAVKEQERLQAAIKNLNKDIAKAQASLEKSASEHQKQLSQVKEELNSVNIKQKWAQGKLKTETEAHNECKGQLAAMTKKYQSAKEEGEQIRADLKAMIKQYQESEEMRSNSLVMKLKKAEDEMKQQEQEIADQQQLHQLTVKELELIKSAHQITQQECQQLKAKVTELNTKLSEQKAEMDEHIICVTKLKFENKKLITKASGVDELTQQLESERTKLAATSASLSQLQQSYENLEKEVTQSKERERELLAFSEKLSSANAELLTEKSGTEAKLHSLMEERQNLANSLLETQKAQETLQTELNTLREQSDATIADLSQQLATKTEAVEQLTVSLDDEREQNNALKKKNASNLKDLQKQLQQCQKRIEQLETSNEAEAPATLPVSVVTRTSSPESVDGGGMVVLSSQPSAAAVQHDDDVQVHVTQNSSTLFRHLDHEKEVLVEKLCVLKKEIAKKQEKLEFYEEHIAQLTEEIKKKSKIIQDFVLREHAGAVTSPLHDSHKARRAVKGGVMASVFTGKLHHNEMTFDLSLEINRKMQSVLEDALLKNIMLKENVDTLGNEIARLSAQLQQSQNR